MAVQPISTIRSTGQSSDLAAILSRAVAVATFNRNGAIVAGDESDPLPVHRPGRIALWYCRLKAVSSSDSVFTLYLNGVEVTSTTVLAGEETSAVTEILGPAMSPFEDYLVATVTSTGSGGSGFVGLAVLI